MKLGMYEDKPTFLAYKNDQIWGTTIEGYSSIDEILDNWQSFVSETLMNTSDKEVILNDHARLIDQTNLAQPITKTRQIPALGFNYADHMTEMAQKRPKKPNVFNKFISSLSGPKNSITLSSNTVDWETELVIVIGRDAKNIAQEDADGYIAGYMVGQDLSDRNLQSIDGPVTQFTLAKSFKNYSPIGPYLTTLGSTGDMMTKHLTTHVNDTEMQNATLSNLIFDIPTLISYISGIIELYPGDLIFTGTPSGTGIGHDPHIFLKSGDVITSEITGLGKIRTTVN